MFIVKVPREYFDVLSHYFDVPSEFFDVPSEYSIVHHYNTTNKNPLHILSTYNE